MQPPSHVQSIAFAVMGAVSMSVVDASMKWLVTDYEVLQILSIRALFLLPIAILWAWFSDRHRGLIPPEWPWLLLRACFVLIAPFLFFTGLKTVPLADATVLFFTAPLFIIIGSILLFKDRVGLRRWLAVSAGFAGALIVLRPGLSVFKPEAVLPLGAAFFYALTALISRHLAGRTRLARLLLAQTIGWTLVYIPLSYANWQPMPAHDIALVALTSVANLLVMIGLTTAYMHAPAHIVGPFEYTVLPFALLFGYVIWGDVPDGAVYLGAALIVGAGLFILFREARLKKAAKAR